MHKTYIPLAISLIIILAVIFFIGIFKNRDLKKPAKLSLKKVVENAMVDSTGRYGIVIENFKSGENYSLNEHQSFESGSLYKLWVMATVFQKLKEGILKENDLLSEDVSVLNNDFDIDPENAELQDGIITLTVAQALEQMITISHNYAALLLIENVKRSNISKFLKDSGFNESSLGNPPKTTPADLALFLEKLYKGEIVDKETSQNMLELLKKQELNDGLPKYLPNISIAHKTGDINQSKHDAGIIFSPKGDYIIVVLSETDSPPTAQERIALVSKAVFDYFNSSGNF